MSCAGQCSGCALKPGAAANLEVNNRLVGILTALGGIPFLCHHRLGWTPDREGYPNTDNSVKMAMDNLMAAPKLIHNSPELSDAIEDATATGIPSNIFDDDRKLVGPTPHCQGWRSAVAELNNAGWFASIEDRKRRRLQAKAGLKLMDELKTEKGKSERKMIIRRIGTVVMSLAKDLKAAGIKPGEWWA